MSTQLITDQDRETIRKTAVDGKLYETHVEVELTEFIDRDLEQLLDLISTRATGSPLLQDVEFSVVDFKDVPSASPTFILKVKGDTSAIVADIEANRFQD